LAWRRIGVTLCLVQLRMLPRGGVLATGVARTFATAPGRRIYAVNGAERNNSWTALACDDGTRSRPLPRETSSASAKRLAFGAAVTFPVSLAQISSRCDALLTPVYLPWLILAVS
jgi:hypothetical protein